MRWLSPYWLWALLALPAAGFLSMALLLVTVLVYFRKLRALLLIFLPLVSGVVIMMAYIRM